MTEIDPETAAIEARLRSYRPAAPPETLRAKVLAGASGSRRPAAPGWLTLAALLFLAVALRWSARSDLAAASGRTRGAPLPFVTTPPMELDPGRSLAILQRLGQRPDRPDTLEPLVDFAIPGGAR
jgi:hypothetical protein